MPLVPLETLIISRGVAQHPAPRLPLPTPQRVAPCGAWSCGAACVCHASVMRTHRPGRLPPARAARVRAGLRTGPGASDYQHRTPLQIANILALRPRRAFEGKATGRGIAGKRPSATEVRPPRPGPSKRAGTTRSSSRRGCLRPRARPRSTRPAEPRPPCASRTLGRTGDVPYPRSKTRRSAYRLARRHHSARVGLEVCMGRRQASVGGPHK